MSNSLCYEKIINESGFYLTNMGRIAKPGNVMFDLEEQIEEEVLGCLDERYIEERRRVEEVMDGKKEGWNCMTVVDLQQENGYNGN